MYHEVTIFSRRAHDVILQKRIHERRHRSLHFLLRLMCKYVPPHYKAEKKPYPKQIGQPDIEAAGSYEWFKIVNLFFVHVVCHEQETHSIIEPSDRVTPSLSSEAYAYETACRHVMLVSLDVRICLNASAIVCFSALLYASTIRQLSAFTKFFKAR